MPKERKKSKRHQDAAAVGVAMRADAPKTAKKQRTKEPPTVPLFEQADTKRCVVPIGPGYIAAVTRTCKGVVNGFNVFGDHVFWLRGPTDCTGSTKTERLVLETIHKWYEGLQYTQPHGPLSQERLAGYDAVKSSSKQTKPI